MWMNELKRVWRQKWSALHLLVCLDNAPWQRPDKKVFSICVIEGPEVIFSSPNSCRCTHVRTHSDTDLHAISHPPQGKQIQNNSINQKRVHSSFWSISNLLFYLFIFSIGRQYWAIGCMLNYGPSYTLMILTNMTFGKACCGSDKQHLMNACDGVNVFFFF